MSHGFVLYDDQRARALHPFALTRPAGELRAGAELIRERWEWSTGQQASGFVAAATLRDFEEVGAPPAATGVLAAGTIVVNSRGAPRLAPLPAGDAWHVGGRVAAVRLSAPLEVAALADGTLTLESLTRGPAVEIDGWWIDDVWDLIRHLNAMLASDIDALAAEGDSPPAQLTVLGAHPAMIARGAYVEPLAFADTSAGPVLVRDGARISAFTRLVGPCVIGRNAMVAGGRVSGCSIGDGVRVHGEISASIMIGQANKAHDGFVGHSVIGRWANLGAGTITSNLKNSYGEVAMWTAAGQRDTGLQFLGTMLGDHAKTGIGTRLTTGCVIGTGANVFGSEMPPKFVPPFAWGDSPPYQTFALEKFLEVAERVMSRRTVPLGSGMRALLTEAFSLRENFTP